MSSAAHRYLLTGPEGLGEAELLALVLGEAPLAGRALAELGSAFALSGASPAALAPLLGPARAARLHAAFELSRRAFAGPPARGLVRAPADAAAWLVPRFAGLDHEELHVLLLDARGAVLTVRRMSQGAVDHTLFDVRSVLGEALRVGARSLILAHNHPSGAADPSAEDVLVTRRMVEGGALLGVDVKDHLVVAHGRWTSLAERGELHRAAPRATRLPSA